MVVEVKVVFVVMRVVRRMCVFMKGFFRLCGMLGCLWVMVNLFWELVYWVYCGNVRVGIGLRVVYNICLWCLCVVCIWLVVF